jgi:hypothetical protein
MKEGRYRVKVKGIDALKALIEGKELKHFNFSVKLEGNDFKWYGFDGEWHQETELTIHDFLGWEFEVVESNSENN